jgi:NAD+ synthase
MKIKIAVVQSNPTVGALDANMKAILDAYHEAADKGADLVITPEMSLTGYPLEDLVLRHSFMDAVAQRVSLIQQAVEASGKTAALIFGAPAKGLTMDGGVTNNAYMIDPTERVYKRTTVMKTELPNYGVFDEKRIFKPSSYENAAFTWRGYRIGLMVCEDAWFPKVTKQLADTGATFLIAINGSPFEAGKNAVRRRVIANRVKEVGLPFLYVNLVGGQDELVFDGGSFLYDGQKVQEAPHFVAGTTYFDLELAPNTKRIGLDGYAKVVPTSIGAIYQALVLGLRDYLRKQGFKKVVLGYSGGVDSGLVAAIACDAIGAENVLLVSLPSNFSSDHSKSDAFEGAKRLGAELLLIPIEPVVEQLRQATHGALRLKDGTTDVFKPRIIALSGVADENIQARARGNILMALSNQLGHLLLTTGNKSEVSVGYATLYGDMSGGFNPIKDCYKTTVWELCRWRNAIAPADLDSFGFLGKSGIDVVPEEIIVKPPSAELRADQKDSDSLPEYPVLDSILKAMIEEELGDDEIVTELALRLDLVKKIRKLVDMAEYKRRQAAPGVKITSKIHGKDRRYPIVNHWRGD